MTKDCHAGPCTTFAVSVLVVDMRPLPVSSKRREIAINSFRLFSYARSFSAAGAKLDERCERGDDRDGELHHWCQRFSSQLFICGPRLSSEFWLA